MATSEVHAGARAPEMRAGPLTEAAFSYVNWSAIVAGAGGGCAGVGAARLRRRGRSGGEFDRSDLAGRLVCAGGALGLYLVLVAIVAYGAGGYVVGRLRARLSAGPPDEIEFRDGVHGAAAWALATLLAALIAFGGAQALTRLAAPSSGPAGSSTSVAGENLIAYDLDRLFRKASFDLL